MKNCTFLFKHKFLIQAIIAIIIVFICWHPKIYLHPIIVVTLVCCCYTLHSYIENRITLKRLQYKYSKQEKILSTVYKNSEELIAYRDVDGNYLSINDTNFIAFGIASSLISCVGFFLGALVWKTQSTNCPHIPF